MFITGDIQSRLTGHQTQKPMSTLSAARGLYYSHSHRQPEFGLLNLAAFQSRIQASPANGMQSATSGGANQFGRVADILLEMSDEKSNNALHISSFHQDKH